MPPGMCEKVLREALFDKGDSVARELSFDLFVSWWLSGSIFGQQKAAVLAESSRRHVHLIE